MVEKLKKKIIYLPLDERPCNYNYPLDLLQDNSDYELIVPPKTILGNKKSPADFNNIKEFLLNNASGSYGLVLSIDMLVYGGLVPSRLHKLDLDELTRRLEIIKELKEKNKNLKIYAFSLIMRCPQYSSSDEEPDYYEEVGREIFLHGSITHKKELGIASKEEIDSLDTLSKTVKPYLQDFLSRRDKNANVNIKALDLVKKYIDFMIIPQDDSSEYGYIVYDQQKIKSHVANKNLFFDVLIYPGADEVGQTLVAKMITNDKKISPKIFVMYSSENAHTLIPLYEDRPIGESIKSQIVAVGGIRVYDVNSADLILAVNAPTKNMTSASMQFVDNKDYSCYRNLTDFCTQIEYLMSIKKKVIVADIAYVNGSDEELLKMLSVKNLLFNLAGYSGWNTAGNSLGTTLATGVIYNIYGKTETHKSFLALRYYEDLGYCTYARKYVCDNYLKELGLNYFNSGDKEGKVSSIVKDIINDYIKLTLKEVFDNYKIENCIMPWARMFEVELKIQKRK